MAQALTQMEENAMMLLDVFNTYTPRKREVDKLNKGELKQLLNDTFPNFLKAMKRHPSFDYFYNMEEEISFENFMALIGRITQMVGEDALQH
ncbi:protein S100-A9-like [Meriones unguiculatus]|uniref:protein S100-A9-like n=1 Tax=Meriones unguiculatus TaxID=10047 RepID=UPI000B4F5BB9|nr:protein S100-A9-like [Meriones unguiculatus]XP_060249280.1 protein S100-A9-like [Meriones unguiculatus]XP_060249281.1 protein S100-A9-like [Meriones unguiculatus]